MSYPKTAKEYWDLVDNNKEALQGLIARYHPYYRNQHCMKITAPGAEKACEEIREEIAAKSEDPWTDEKIQPDPQVRFTEFCQKRDSRIVSLFNDIWFGMPESEEVRFEEGFNELCDLCSEGYLIDEEGPQE